MSRFDLPSFLTRRDFLRGVTVTAGAIFVGCRPQNSANGVTISQWYHQYGEEGTHEAVLRYAQAYTKANPTISVHVEWVPGDYQTKLNTALLVKGGPDVFEKQLSIPMVTAGQVAPLDFFGCTDKAFDDES